jgi:hypothetical protein
MIFAVGRAPVLVINVLHFCNFFNPKSRASKPLIRTVIGFVVSLFGVEGALEQLDPLLSERHRGSCGWALRCGTAPPLVPIPESDWLTRREALSLVDSLPAELVEAWGAELQPGRLVALGPCWSKAGAGAFLTWLKLHRLCKEGESGVGSRVVSRDHWPAS